MTSTKFSLFQALQFFLFLLMIKHGSSFSPISFQRFTFAPNGVCIKPELFYAPANTDDKQIFTMRNVPGEGDCMFLAVALATATSMGLGGNDPLLRAIAAETRDVVAQVLGSDGNLHIEKKRLVSAPRLLSSAARQEGMTTDEYLDRLRQGGNFGGLQGGGPELTVLSNVLRRPISMYELYQEETEEEEASSSETTTPISCRIRKVGVFGDIFSDPCLTIPDSAVLSGLQPGAYSWHLHILVVDVGHEKHACALLPQ